MKTNTTRPADWVAWLLQALFGSLVGALIGFVIIRPRRFYGYWMCANARPIFLIGAALFTAAVASRVGDRLWLADHYRTSPPESPRQSLRSNLLSLVIGLVGFAMLVISLVIHFTNIGDAS